MIYYFTIDDAVTGAVADDYTTMIGLKAVNTVGHRGRLLQLIIGPADDTPQDLNLGVRVNKTDNTADGTATSVASANIPKADDHARNSIMTAYHTYTVEPTTYGTYPLYQTNINRRGGIIQTWDRDGPTWGPNETLGILLAPRTAAAARVSITLVWEED